MHPATGSHPHKWARCRAEQVPSRCVRWMRPRRRARAGPTRLGRLHCRIPASGAPAPSYAGPLLRRPRAHLLPVRALPGADFAGFPTGACGHANTQSRLLQHAGIDKKPTEQDTNSSWNPNLQSTSCAVLRAGLRGLREVNTRTPGYDLGRSFHAPLLRYFLIVSTVCHAVPCSAEKTSGPSRPLTAATR